ncbi:MAG: sigma-70 family RNA polymerase sigma factor [bacterium]|nr:sigma-70 family RNA polymerase sigma factor [bacterium]
MNRRAIIGVLKVPTSDSHSITERAETVAAILEELRAGASVDDGFRRLFELYYRPLCQFFAHRGFPPEECLDLTQETFFGIYTGVGSFRRQAGFDTWLFKVATNVFRKHLRKGAAGKRAGEEVPVEAVAEPRQPGRSPEEEAQHRERVRLFREALKRLPEQQRTCIAYYVEGHRYREIAVFMQLSTETVKAHLHHAKRRLREELGPYAGPEIDALDKEDR